MAELPDRSSNMYALIFQYDLHSKFFTNVLADITDKDAHNRLNSKANHIAWIAGSCVHLRFELAKAMGVDKKEKHGDLYKQENDMKPIQDDLTYPSLTEFKQEWERITPVLKDIMMNLNEEKLNSPDPFGMPGGEFKLIDTLIFCLDRESYCIGQIGIFRRLLGYDAMKYD
jgi:hypothetical protein